MRTLITVPIVCALYRLPFVWQIDLINRTAGEAVTSAVRSVHC
jgi:hypothetical protein